MESMSAEMERMGESQRFVTRLLQCGDERTERVLRSST